MKKSIFLLLASSVLSVSAFATNGTQLIGVGSKARAMGGVGVATYHGSESAFNNPALYSKAKGMSANLGFTLLSPNVSYQDKNGVDKSTYGSSFLPDAGFAYKIDDQMAVGFGVASTAGLGVEYPTTGDSAAAGVKNELGVVQVSIPFSYNISGVSIGIAPILQYSSLSNNAKVDGASSTDFGANFGLAYDIDSITLALMYKLAISSEYTDAFPTPIENPSVLGLGVSYAITQSSTIALDYKMIGYGSVEAFQNIGWINQHVVALGYEFDNDSLAIRVGANYGTDVIPDDASLSETISTYIGFPALTAAHATIGGGYNFGEFGRVDVSFVYGMSFSDSYTYPVDPSDPVFGGSELVKASNNQTSFTLDYTYNF